MTDRVNVCDTYSRKARSITCTSGWRVVVVLALTTFIPMWSIYAKSSLRSLERRIVDKEKRFGQIYTPGFLVKDILDFAGYKSEENILEKHVIDNSCGDGAFLLEVVRRYCKAYSQLHGKKQKKELSLQLHKYIHGIELDVVSYGECLRNLKKLAEELDLPLVNWDVRNADTMTVAEFDGMMDFVVGNPPYVRVHNLDKDFQRVKRYRFCDGGMTDLYLVFYEIGLRMLAQNGRLCYIAPSSWINSVAGKNMREHLQSAGCLRGIIDLQHYQAFNATTYTAITLLENGYSGDSLVYNVYEGPNRIHFIDNIDYKDAFFDGALFLGDKKTLAEFKKMKTAQVPSLVEVKNGFATLADDVFIADSFSFSRFTIPVIKASTGKWYKAFYPYDTDGNPIAREKVFSDVRVASYLEGSKEILLKGRHETECPDWFRYGRTQALKDVRLRKYAINTVIRDVASIKLNAVPEGAGVYSGLYIITDVPEKRLREVILCDDFIQYVSLLKKYKSGGYYTFNSRELKQYLNYKLQEVKLMRHGCRQHQMLLPFD